MKQLLLVCLLLVPGLAQALSLTGEVRWQGEVHQTETVRVEPGASLIIAPGAKVTFAAGQLEVAGRLQARQVSFAGTHWQGVVLKGCASDTLVADSSVRGAEIGIQVIGGEPRIEGTDFESNRVGLELRQSQASVSGCRFQDNAKVGLFVKDESRAAIINNSFIGNGKFGCYIFRAQPRRFAGNTFNANPVGIMVSYFGSDPLLEENCLTGNQVAIRVDRAARPTLRRNDLRDNGTGLDLYRRADPLVEANRIAGNKVGVQIAYSSYPQLHGNDLSGNGVALLLKDQSMVWEREKGARVRSGAASQSPFGGRKRGQVGEAQRAPRQQDGSVDARDNWWGKDATAELTRLGADGNVSFIVDGRDSAGFKEDGKLYPLDVVRYAPWRLEAVTWP